MKRSEGKVGREGFVGGIDFGTGVYQKFEDGMISGTGRIRSLCLLKLLTERSDRTHLDVSSRHLYPRIQHQPYQPPPY